MWSRFASLTPLGLIGERRRHQPPYTMTYAVRSVPGAGAPPTLHTTKYNIQVYRVNSICTPTRLPTSTGGTADRRITGAGRYRARADTEQDNGSPLTRRAERPCGWMATIGRPSRQACEKVQRGAAGGGGGAGASCVTGPFLGGGGGASSGTWPGPPHPAPLIHTATITHHATYHFVICLVLSSTEKGSHVRISVMSQ